MGLDPQCAAVLAALSSMGLPAICEMTPPKAREVTRALSLLMGEPEEVDAVHEVEIPGPAGAVPARVYRPAVDGPLPATVFFHGGGWVFGDPDLTDPITRALANRTGSVVVSVDYRLAPEHPYPAAPEDCYAAVRWVAEHGESFGADPSRVAVAGDSAGANLSTVVCLMARDRGGPRLAFQALVYPVTDYSFDTPSHRENGEGYLITTGDMRWFWGHYLSGGGDGTDPYASPLRAPDLSALPPAFIATAEFDPLRDEGEAYGHRLAEAGVAAEVRRYDGQMHGFFWMPAAVERGRELMDDMAAALRKAFES